MADGRIEKLTRLTNLMRDIGSSYVDYVKPLTWLLHVKMAAELNGDLWGLWSRIAQAPPGRQEQALLDVLGSFAPQANRPDTATGMVFRGVFNPWGNGATLRKIVDVVGSETWTGGDGDFRGELYEALLAKGAVDVRQGFGQYFTPRPLVDAIVEVMDPRPGERVHDPACGTGGFLVAAHRHSGGGAEVTGNELVDVTARLAQENLILRGAALPDRPPTITIGDALAAPGPQADVVLANPPFGSGIGDRGERPDWWAQTSDKQVGFVQHIMRQLAPGGRAAVIVPEGVLDNQGAAETVRRVLTTPGGEWVLHTLLRLPTGIFYADGVNANVLFIDRIEPGGDARTGLWVYDLRTDNRFTLKRHPLTRADLDDFVECFQADPGDFVECFQADPGETGDSGNPRWRWFSPDEIAERDRRNLSMKWNLSGRGDDYDDPASLAEEISAELLEAARLMREIGADLRRVLPRYDPPDQAPAPAPAPAPEPEPEPEPKGHPDEVPACGGFGMQQLIPLEGDS